MISLFKFRHVRSFTLFLFSNAIYPIKNIYLSFLNKNNDFFMCFFIFQKHQELLLISLSKYFYIFKDFKLKNFIKFDKKLNLKHFNSKTVISVIFIIITLIF